MSRPDNRSLDERLDNLLMTTMRMMPLKSILVRVIGNSPFTMVSGTIRPIRNFIAFLTKRLLTHALLFSKMSQSVFT
jgi:hypothetical protein